MTDLHTVAALKRLFSADASVRIWDYGADFNDIWSIESLQPTQPAIVVWADTPVDPVVRPVATDEHLTPFDWALTARCKYSNLRVTVLDLRPKEHDKARYAALQWWHTQKPDCVPWLRRVTVAELVAASTPKEVEEALVPTAWASDASSHSLPVRNVLRSLPACQVDINPSATHHAIANLVGPLLLLPNSPQRAPAQAAFPNHQEALRQILIAAGIVDTSRASAAHEGKGVCLGGDVRLVLVDDQWRHGWAEWLANCLGIEFAASSLDEKAQPEASQRHLCVAGDPSNVSLWVVSSADWLLDRVKSALHDKEKGDARFALRLIADDAEKEYREILLLDLRLVPQGSLAEKQLAQGVAELAKRFVEHGAWSLFGDKELKDVIAWANSPDQPTLLSLLPRLVAHVDPTLPIVLFSSTGRRDIIGKLDGYESIFTRFRKPHLLLGPSAEIAERAWEALDGELKAAARLAAWRMGIQRILAAKAEEAEVEDYSSFKHAALYIDESGGYDKKPDGSYDKWLAIGGILALFPDGDSEEKLNKALINSGIHWGPNGLGKRSEPSVQQKTAESIFALAREQGVKLLGVAVTADIGTLRDVGHMGFEATRLDMLHRMLLRTLCTYCLLLALDGDDRAWTILADCRVQKAPGRGTDREKMERFGLRKEPTKTAERIVDAGDRLKRAIYESPKITDIDPDLLKTWLACQAELVGILVLPSTAATIKAGMKIPFLQPASVYPLIDDLLEDHRRNPRLDKLLILEAQACILPDGGPGATSPPSRSLHYFADWFVRAVWRAECEETMEKWAAGLAKAGFVVRYEQPMLGLADIVQALEEGRTRAGVAKLAGAAAWIAAGVDKDILGRRCLRVIRERLDVITGADLVKALLEAEERETGRIVTWELDQNDEGVGFIESDSFQGVSHITSKVLRTLHWTPYRGESVKFLRAANGVQVVVTDVWRREGLD